MANQGYLYVKLRGGNFRPTPRKKKDKKRVADFVANVQLAQQIFGSLPNLDFWYITSDQPGLLREDFHQDALLLPPLGYTTTKRHYDVSIPYSRQQVWNEEDEVTHLGELVLQHPWEKKVNRTIWRGSTTGQPEPSDATNCWRLPRAVLVNISIHHPELLDARFTSCKQCNGPVKALYEQAGYGYNRFFTYEEQFQYKSLADVDGNSWSSRFAQLLSINSAVFKQETQFTEFFRPLVQPNVHYFPIKEDLSDLVSNLQTLSAPDNSHILRDVAAASTRLYIRQLLPSKQLCYLHLLLKEMGRLHGPTLEGKGGGGERKKKDNKKGKLR